MTDKYLKKAQDIIDNWSPEEDRLGYYVDEIANALANAEEAGYKQGAKAMLVHKPTLNIPEEPTNPDLSADYRQGWLDCKELFLDLNK